MNSRLVRHIAYGGVCLLALAACSPRVPTKLDEPAIRSLVDAGVRASAQRDASALCAQLTDDAQIRLIEVRFSGSDVKTFEKSQWCEYLRQGYAALPQGLAINTSVNLRSIDIAADGKSAELSMEVVEEISSGARSVRMSTQQSGTVILLAGQPRYAKLTARITGGQ